MGSTALHYAVKENQLETTKLLLKYGADPFLGTEWGLDTLKIASVAYMEHLKSLNGWLIMYLTLLKE